MKVVIKSNDLRSFKEILIEFYLYCIINGKDNKTYNFDENDSVSFKTIRIDTKYLMKYTYDENTIFYKVPKNLGFKYLKDNNIDAADIIVSATKMKVDNSIENIIDFFEPLVSNELDILRNGLKLCQ